MASTIDVSGSEFHISAPSASAAGDDFKIYISGSLFPSDSSSVDLGDVITIIL